MRRLDGRRAAGSTSCSWPRALAAAPMRPLPAATPVAVTGEGESAADACRQVVGDLSQVDEVLGEGDETLQVGGVGGEPERRTHGVARGQPDHTVRSRSGT